MDTSPEPTSQDDSKVDAVQTSSSSTAIFKLDIDCFHEIFDWLRLDDLISIGNTCRRLQQVAGDFYRTNYGKNRMIAENGAGCKLYRDLNVFTPYIEKISISGNNLKLYNFIGKHCKSTKEIRLANNLCEDAIECLKKVLQKVEVIELNESFMRQEFYESFLRFCPKLKNLSIKRLYKIRDKSVIIGLNNDWLLRKYPTLEHLELIDIYELRNNELKTFFELNPNVRSFSTDSVSFEENLHFFLSTDVKLNKLAIEYSSRNVSDNVHDLLAQLYEKGCFKTLYIYSACDLQANLDQFLSKTLSSAVESLHLDISWRWYDEFHIDVCLKNLKVLAVDNLDKVADIENLPSKLPNIEKIYFIYTNSKEILPFIRKSPKLKTILLKRRYYAAEFPDLIQMNQERKKLAGARKVAIYLCENNFLASKWGIKKTNLEMIELRRFESFEWNYLNSHFRHYHSIRY